MKHCLEGLIYLLNRNKNFRVNGEVKSSKSMLIKSASTIGPGRGGTSYLTDFDET